MKTVFLLALLSSLPLTSMAAENICHIVPMYRGNIFAVYQGESRMSAYLPLASAIESRDRLVRSKSCTISHALPTCGTRLMFGGNVYAITMDGRDAFVYLTRDLLREKLGMLTQNHVCVQRAEENEKSAKQK